MELSLDNRLYVLRNSNLSDDLRKKLVEADRLFLRDRDSESQEIVLGIEGKCFERNIAIFDPTIK